MFNSIGSFLEAAYNHPKAGYWIVIALLSFWLIGIVVNWKWAYQPFGWLSHYLMDLFGSTVFRVCHAVILIIAIACTVYLLIKSYK